MSDDCGISRLRAPSANIPFFADPPIAPTIAGWPTTGSVKVGNSLTLTCAKAATGGTPTSYELYRGAAKLTTTGNEGQTYTIASASLTDEGDYKCKAINADGSAESTVKTLDVKGRLRSTSKYGPVFKSMVQAR